MKIIRLVRAVKLRKILVKLEGNSYNYIIDLLSIAAVINKLIAYFKLGLLIFCIAHWCSCIWYMVALWQDEINKTWVGHQDHLIDANWDIKYICALYFSIATMTTVGFGDIHPETSVEMCFAILAMVVASGVFGYTMNSIMVI
jgi:hypothetical protein